ncbi:MAG: glycoside hydrolase family 3 N-terminal domain-containing protein [Cyclobacteriaceae bacterium]|nr:glycoside hydrolase family 3 N-terminal domain-containing protein [Cyclobacteriaceae bacterium]
MGTNRLLVSGLIFCAALFLLIACNQQVRWTESGDGDIHLVTNEGGPVLGYSLKSGVTILTSKGFAFKDLNKNGKIDDYEDWRLSTAERTADLASKMTIEQIAGLMLYSGHQSIPAGGRGPFSGMYGGKPFRESGAQPSDLSDAQIKFLMDDNLRHVLITNVQSPQIAAQWNNNAQALVEGLGLGIPANNSSDPRHRTRADAEYNAGSGGQISMWPGSLGLAATFDPEIMQQFGDIASKEYRALGIATALSPQVDLATDPRWMRVSGTFGENPQLAADMARAYTDGFQTSTGDAVIANGWGYESVNAMVKHWPGGGTGEGGRDAHYGFGKYAVYPGNNFQEQLIPFINGAFDLKGGTGMASAVMPYYTISYGQNPDGENVGNSFSKYIITDLLRTKYGYQGVVCTDWNITADETAINVFLSGKSWGVEGLTVAERHYKVLMAGVDQFGGNNDSGPVLEAYQMGVKELGEKAMRQRFEESAVRLLTNIFRVGLFENPYLNVEKSGAIVGSPEFMQAGYTAQLKSIVMLKNKAGALPFAKDQTVYVPKRYVPPRMSFMGTASEEKLEYPVNMDIVNKYFKTTDNPAEADFAIVFIESPESGGGYNIEDAKSGEGNGYFPINLQYGPYTAASAREESMAGGDPLEVFKNRSYKGKTANTDNFKDLESIVNARKVMKNKPVIVVLNMANPTVFGEFENSVNGILVHFGVQDQALMDIIAGVAEPSALLPLQMPANMETVEQQAEDVPQDMECYKDSEGNSYDFAYGMNWSGVD